MTWKPATTHVDGYPWPSDEVHDLWLREAHGSEALAQERHAADLLELKAYREATARMEAMGYRTHSDGSWRDRAFNNGNRQFQAFLNGARKR